ncbi:MAG: hypothetical protein AAB590_02010 [Patescibacteria group bacterium]
MKKDGAKKNGKNRLITNKDLSHQIEVLASNVNGIAERLTNVEDNMATKRDLKDTEERLDNRIRGLERRMDEFAVQYVKKEHHMKLAEKVSKLEHRV